MPRQDTPLPVATPDYAVLRRRHYATPTLIIITLAAYDNAFSLATACHMLMPAI